MLFPIFLSPRAVEATRSQWLRGSTRRVSHEPSGWRMTQFRVHPASFFQAAHFLKGGCFYVKMRFVKVGYICAALLLLSREWQRKTAEREVASKCCRWRKLPFLRTADSKQPAVFVWQTECLSDPPTLALLSPDPQLSGSWHSELLKLRSYVAPQPKGGEKRVLSVSTFSLLLEFLNML